MDCNFRIACEGKQSLREEFGILEKRESILQCLIRNNRSRFFHIKIRIVEEIVRYEVWQYGRCMNIHCKNVLIVVSNSTAVN